MAFQINTNVPSLQAQEYLRITSEFQYKTINRVTSGLRIISSGDDAAGLAIANGFRSDQAVLTQGIRNANDGLSTLQTIDGGINNISKLLDRARTLATQSASGTFTGSRSVLNSEFQNVIQEINRQAQSIGLDTGGQFAKSLQVFIGGGKTNGGISDIDNGSVGLDLSSSTVDAQSLGLSGVRAASLSGTDLSTSSATTSVSQIVADTTNIGSLETPGFTDFYFRGAGFSDDDRVKVSVNLSGVTNTNTLATALNAAIDSAGDGASSAATAFQNANVRAVVVTDTQPDGTVKERLGFISSTGAFQVQAGDRLSNALLGNFSSAAIGDAIGSTFVGGVAVSAGATTFAGTANVIVRVQGGGLSGPVDITLNVTAATTVTEALTSLSTQVGANTALQTAGITLDTASGASNLAFTSARGDRFEVLSAGDTSNLLGLGSFDLATATGTLFDYTSITGTGGVFAAGTTQVVEFSIAGGAKQSITVAAASATTVAAAVVTLNAAFTSNSVLQNAGLVATVSGGQIKIDSSNGSAFRVNGVAAGAVNSLGFGVLGTAFAGNLQSTISGTNAENYAIVGATNDVFSVSVDGATAISVTLTAGAARTAAQIAADLNGSGAFAAVARAQVVNNRVSISTINAGSTLKIESVALNAYAALGFTAGENNLIDKSTVNSGGAYHTALGTNDDAFSYRQIRNGSDDQTVTINATDAHGAQHSLSVVLRNDTTSASGNTLDQALSAINTALQQSGDATLKQIVAVKEHNFADDGEGFRFLSTLQDFRVSIGVAGTSTAASEIGAFDGTTGSATLGQGSVSSAEQSTGGSQLDISNVSAASAAVTSLAAAVSLLGDAQAVVGRGQNQFSFAVNLAQSQLTNIAAAESRIRDADLAAEAANLTKAQIILQAGIAALGQANTGPQAILALLRG